MQVQVSSLVDDAWTIKKKIKKEEEEETEEEADIDWDKLRNEILRNRHSEFHYTSSVSFCLVA